MVDTIDGAPPEGGSPGGAAPGPAHASGASWGDRVLSHPALKSLGSRMRVESFPQTLLFCAGPVLIPAAAALAHARQEADGWRR